MDAYFAILNSWIASLIFYDVLPGPAELPLAVLWLGTGAVFFTVYFGFINVRGFKHAVDLVRGKFDSPDDPGEVSHFQALTTALSATVGLGNIAGVAIAVGLGGPGATFWMIVAGLLGMSSKFTECTLAVMYREVRSDGKLMGGPMEYLAKGFRERHWPRFGKSLSVLFSILCVGGALGGGNSFQVSQSLSAVKGSLPFLQDSPWIYGAVLTLLTGLVIIGGIRSIAKVTERLVPVMVAIYLMATFFILISHFSEIPAAFSAILAGAFTPQAGYGGFIGVLVTGLKRAAFSNEAGMGSAAIAHSAARTKIPVREGYVALLEPFIDTVVTCTLTSLVIIISGVYTGPESVGLIAANQGAALTALAFGSVISWFPHVLSLCVVLFAFSTMISWSYYGERCWAYLFGDSTSWAFRTLFLSGTFLGSITSAVNILTFSDLMILAMGFPNMIGLYVLCGKVRQALKAYERELGFTAPVRRSPSQP